MPKKNTQNQTTLFCFTPEIMLITFIIEIILAIYVFIRYRMSKFARFAAFGLVLLATFQLAEHQICTIGHYSYFWTRLGFVVITLLPISGLFLIYLVSKKTHFLKIGYILSFLYLVYFIFVPKAIDGAFCGGNYVIFSTSQLLYQLYGFYYFSFLMLGIWEALQGIRKTQGQPNIRKTLFWFIIGYLSFMLPMSLVYIFIAKSRFAIASIMCGFALLFAFILALKIVPQYCETHKD